MKSASNVASALLIAHNYHHTETNLHLVYLCPCFGLVLFLSYLWCNPFFIFSLIFIIVNHMISLKQTRLFFAYRIFHISFGWKHGWRKWILFKKQSSASGCCLAFAWFFGNFSLVLLIKVLLAWNLIYKVPVLKTSLHPMVSVTRMCNPKKPCHVGSGLWLQVACLEKVIDIVIKLFVNYPFQNCR